MDFKLEYKNKIQIIDEYISDFLETKYAKSHPILLDAMKYSVLNGGKRLRSVLCTEICSAFGGQVDIALKYACAIELIHAYSLVHDDLPAMDNADTRRGQPSCHAKYGETMAILCGDALLNSAYELMSMACSDKKTANAMQIIADCAGACGMVNGQVLDIDISEKKEFSNNLFIKMIEQKTMALIRASVISGATIASCSPEQIDDMEKFAYSLGIAFQIRDDFEDIAEDSAQEGDSPNFISYLGQNEAKLLMNNHAMQSLEILEKYNCEFLILLHKYLFDNQNS